MNASRDILKLSTLDIHSASQLFKAAPAFSPLDCTKAWKSWAALRILLHEVQNSFP